MQLSHAQNVFNDERPFFVQLRVVEHCGMALAALAGVLAIVLPPPGARVLLR